MMWKQKYFRNIKGFTLVELLVTISIIAVLAGIGTVAVFKIRGSTSQVTCMNNLKAISNALQLYYNDFNVFPDDGYPDDSSDLYPLSVDLQDYITNEETFVCPEDDDLISSSGFASYDPFYVARTSSSQTESVEQLAVGCPRHRENNSSTTLFSTGSTEITKVGTVRDKDGQVIPPDGDSDQRKISNVSDKMTFDDGSIVTITSSVADYEVFLVQSVKLSDGTLYSIIRVSGDGTIDNTVASGSKFEIVTPSAIVGVRGTEFTVQTSNSGGSTDVDITSGEVVMINRASGKSETLTPGNLPSSTISKNEHTHKHWHADGTYHNHPHPEKNKAHHGRKKKIKKADNFLANKSLFDMLVDTSATSSDIKNAIVAASSVSKSVLKSVIHRKPALVSSDLKDILVSKSPLKRKVLKSIIRKYSAMNSSDNKAVLIANSPLPKKMLKRIRRGRPPMNSSDLQAVLNAQDDGSSN